MQLVAEVDSLVGWLAMLIVLLPLPSYLLVFFLWLLGSFFLCTFFYCNLFNSSLSSLLILDNLPLSSLRRLELQNSVSLLIFLFLEWQSTGDQVLAVGFETLLFFIMLPQNFQLSLTMNISLGMLVVGCLKFAFFPLLWKASFLLPVSIFTLVQLGLELSIGKTESYSFYLVSWLLSPARMTVLLSSCRFYLSPSSLSSTTLFLQMVLIVWLYSSNIWLEGSRSTSKGRDLVVGLSYYLKQRSMFSQADSEESERRSWLFKTC